MENICYTCNRKFVIHSLEKYVIQCNIQILGGKESNIEKQYWTRQKIHYNQYDVIENNEVILGSSITFDLSKITFIGHMAQMVQSDWMIIFNL